MLPRPSHWKPSDLIRNLITGRLYMVLHVIKGYATIIAALDETELPPTVTLFPRDYEKYTKDTNAIEENGKWRSDTITLWKT